MKLYPLLASLLLLAGCNDTQTTKTAATAAKSSMASSATQAPEPAAAATPKPTKQSTAASSAVAVKKAHDNTTATSAPQLVHKPETSPAVLFQKCAACHGNHAEKSALNQSQIIGEWDSKRIASAIIGYQDGSYGGAMKTLMQNQVKDLNRMQVEALAEYIANLYVKTH